MALCNSRFVYCIITACLASAFQYGYYASVMNIPYQLIKSDIILKRHVTSDMGPPTNYRLDDSIQFGQRPLQRDHYEVNDEIKTRADLIETRKILWPLTLAMLPLGAMLGSALTVLIANSCLGRLSIIYCTLFPLAVAIALQYICLDKVYESVLIVARLIIGLNLGISAGICPIYLVEISNIATRGAAVTAYQLFTVMSIVYGQGIGYFALNHIHEWPVYISTGTLIIVFTLYFVVKFCPESPNYILITEDDRENKAKANLVLLRNSSNVDQEFEEMKKEDRLVKEHPATLSDIPNGPFLLCFVVVIAEQLCGISVFIYYSTEVFVDVRVIKPIICTVCTVFSMLLGIIISICLVEIVGRRTLLLVSLGGLSTIAMVLTPALVYSVDNNVQDFCLVFICLYVCFYSIGLGPARWMIIMELFGYSARPLVVSMVQPVGFLLEFIIAMIFVTLQVESRYYLFILFTICNVAAFCFVFLYMPETKGKRQGEIEISLKKPGGLTENTKEVTTTPSKRGLRQGAASPTKITQL